MSVKVENITKSYGLQKALNQVSFTIQSGEVVGFLGPNGAGKSTMMKIITGFLQPDEGQVWINGMSHNDKSPEVKREIGYLPEHNPLYTDLYVREYLRITASLYRLQKIDQRVEEMIEMTGLGREAHKKIGALSKGYRQRVGLAQALIHDPSVLILDEPTSGLDPAQLVEIRQLIKNISASKTVMLSTHIMQEVEALCSRIMVIKSGTLVSDQMPATLDAFTAQPQSKILAGFAESVTADQLLSIEGVTEALPLQNNQWLLSAEKADCRAAVFHFAVRNNLTLLTLTNHDETLEKRFLDLVK